MVCFWLPVELLWGLVSYEFAIVYVWMSYGFPMDSLWFTFWNTYEFPVVSPWLSYVPYTPPYPQDIHATHPAAQIPALILHRILPGMPKHFSYFPATFLGFPNVSIPRCASWALGGR